MLNAIESGKQIEPQNTLLIFDEIQEVPKALTALKYFCENAPEYTIVAAGSLLGVVLHEGTSFPVGKVDFLTLYPLNYVEFLLALGQENLAALAFTRDYEMINVFSAKYINYLKKYYYIGGMPEAVATYIETDDLTEVRKIQQQLLLYYANDFSKHAPKETVPRIQMVWNSIPMQLAKENRKFIYGAIREGARAKDFELAIQWLEDCGLIHKNYRVSKPGMPLISYMDMSAFKIYMLDVGLLGARGEVDFIVQKSGKVIPIEVKAEENLQAKSLRALCQKYQLTDAIRSSMSNYREQDWMINVPLYILSSFIHGNK